MKVLDALLITAAVLFPFGWFIYRLIRYTAKSLGDESPLAISVTYQVSEQEYFTRFDFLFLILFLLLNLFYLYVLLFMMMPAVTVYWHGLVLAGCLGSSFYALWWCIRLFQLEWQYWLITKEKTITLDPSDKSLEIATSEETVCFTAADVNEIEKHTPGISSGKLVAGYRYFLFHLKDGRRVYLNHNKSYLDFAIDDYFKTVPVQHIPHKIPWIKAV